MDKFIKHKNIYGALLLVALMGAILFGSYLKEKDEPVRVGYAAFMDAVTNGEVASVTLTDGANLNFTYKNKYAATAQENIALWHERDISHSSVERVIWPDAFHLAHYMTNVMKRIVDGLVVNEAQIARNLDRTRGLLFSGRVLLALVGSGMSREDAYAVVQENAMKCWDGIVSGIPAGGGATFREMLEADPRIADFTKGDPSRLDECFDLDYYLRYVDEIFSRFEVFQDLEGSVF